MPNEAQKGASDFVYWHWTQLLFKNPEIQFVRQDNISIAPFAIAFLGILLNGLGEIMQEIHFKWGVENLTRRRNISYINGFN